MSLSDSGMVPVIAFVSRSRVVRDSSTSMSAGRSEVMEQPAKWMFLILTSSVNKEMLNNIRLLKLASNVVSVGDWNRVGKVVSERELEDILSVSAREEEKRETLRMNLLQFDISVSLSIRFHFQSECVPRLGKSFTYASGSSMRKLELNCKSSKPGRLVNSTGRPDRRFPDKEMRSTSSNKLMFAGTKPVKAFESNLSSLNEIIPPISSGIGPVKRLLDRSKLTKAVRSPRPVGNGLSPSAFLLRSRTSRFPNSSSEAGKTPVKKFNAISKLLKSAKAAKASGSAPSTKFASAAKDSKDSSAPISEGRTPVNVFDERDMETASFNCISSGGMGPERPLLDKSNETGGWQRKQFVRQTTLADHKAGFLGLFFYPRLHLPSDSMLNKERGSVPDSRLPLSERPRSDFRRPISEGISPEMKLENTFKTSSFLIFPMLSGNVEVRKLLPASNTVNIVRSPIASGIDPLN